MALSLLHGRSFHEADGLMLKRKLKFFKNPRMPTATQFDLHHDGIGSHINKDRCIGSHIISAKRGVITGLVNRVAQICSDQRRGDL